MARVVSETGAAIVLMHRKGTPATMQAAPDYADFIPELLEGLRRRIDAAEAGGIGSDRIAIDPGVGFGKRLEDNLRIHGSLGRLHALSKPILFGSSRKSFLGTLTGKDVLSRLPGTIASNVIAAWHGAHILRVHDVPEIRDAMSVVSAVRGSEPC
jgi:dihydropteroate synthase